MITPQIQPDAVSTAIRAALTANTEPHRFYVLGLPQIIDGTPPGDQNLAGWRYLVNVASDLAVAGVIILTNGAPVFAGAAYGRQLAQDVAAFARVGASREAADETYEMRLLRMPGILVDAYWLHASAETDTAKDWVFPYRTISKGLDPRKSYRMNQFF